MLYHMVEACTTKSLVAAQRRFPAFPGSPAPPQPLQAMVAVVAIIVAQQILAPHMLGPQGPAPSPKLVHARNGLTSLLPTQRAAAELIFWLQGTWASLGSGDLLLGSTTRRRMLDIWGPYPASTSLGVGPSSDMDAGGCSMSPLLFPVPETMSSGHDRGPSDILIRLCGFFLARRTTWVRKAARCK